MAGRGPAPKDPSRRVRTNKGAEMRVIHGVKPAEQPDLPTLMVEEDGQLIEFRWPSRTQEWWTMWRDSPLSAEFTTTDWSELLDTALLHAKYWMGDTKVAGELRLRVAKFGATPEDRARLRIQFAAADEADEKRGTRRSGRKRYGGLKLTDPD